jgi:hypothetical protein
MKGYGVNVHETKSQTILDLRHEHRIVLHFPAQLHVDTRLAVSFTVRFFWPHGRLQDEEQQ